MIVRSRCGYLCEPCEFKANGKCRGCLEMKEPFWGEPCAVKTCCEQSGHLFCGECEFFPDCNLLQAHAFDKDYGDWGKVIEQCKIWQALLGK